MEEKEIDPLAHKLIKIQASIDAIKKHYAENVSDLIGKDAGLIEAEIKSIGDEIEKGAIQRLQSLRP